MLVLSRKKNECIVIGEGPGEITVTVVAIEEEKVRIGVEAPREIPVHRREIYDRIHSTAAAATVRPATSGPQLWIIGQIPNGSRPDGESSHPWDFVGVVESEQKAVAACRDRNYFIAPCVLNEVLPHEGQEWAGAYYPLATEGAS